MIAPLWGLVLLYAAARISQAFPDKIPVLVIVALHVLPPLLFALFHGAVLYRPRGILTFTLLCIVVGNLFENLSIFTGFPFGHYHFTEVMGPKLFQAPVLLGLAYIGMGYASWILALVILGRSGGRVAQPLLASFIMVAWDLSMDPIWSNLVHAWSWHQGGAYFGVPLSNFLGWYLTIFMIYFSFAFYLRRRPANSSSPPPSNFWYPAVLLYAVSAAGNLAVVQPPGLSVVADATGTQWQVSGILGASALVSIFVMGGFALLGWVRLFRQDFPAASPLDA
ncbi:MAG TPA: carotenoid biosynthesis protein [Bryobacteraceae bacterium]|nr:carotenoid biosynthesis protein [Bryobacteraceae bacterium]